MAYRRRRTRRTFSRRRRNFKTGRRRTNRKRRIYGSRGGIRL